VREVGLLSTNDKRINILDRDPEFPYVSCWFVPASGMEVARIRKRQIPWNCHGVNPQIAISWKREVTMSKLMLRVSMIALFTVTASLFVFACASAPKEENCGDQAAIQAAQIDDVRTYAADSLKVAEDTLSKAMAEVQTQDDKFAMSRDYKAALRIF